MTKMIPVDQVLEILDAVDRAHRPPALRAPSYTTVITALAMVRERLNIHPAPVLDTDIERAALNAYSEAQAERNARGVFRNADHRAALMAAVDAVDKLRAGQWAAKYVSDETPPPVSAAMIAAKITLTESQVKEAGAIAHRLNDNQRTALLALADAAPKYRMGVVPTGRYAAPSTALALDRRGLVTWRSVPQQGYQLTDMGRAAVASLRDA